MLHKALGMVLIGAVVAWLCVMAPPACAADNPSAPQLTKMEQQLFAHTYPSDSPEDRLSRIENTVFGQPRQDQPVDTRLAALGKFFHDNVPQQSAAMQPQAYRPNQPLQNPAPAPVAPDETSYPIVVKMEQQVLHQTFEKEPLENRLARLEQRVYGHPMQGSLQDRSDHLEDRILGSSPQSPDPNGGDSQVASSGTMAPENAQAANTDVARALPPLENKLFHQTYPQDSIDARLSRIEQKLFNSTASEMSPEDRMYRIASVLTAQRSARNDDPMANASPAGGGYSYGGNNNYGTNGGYYGGYPGTGGGYGRSASWGPLGVTLLMMLMSFL